MPFLLFVCAALSFLFSAWLIRYARDHAQRYAGDMPQRFHWGHVPRVGGVAMGAALLLALAWLGLVTPFDWPPRARFTPVELLAWAVVAFGPVFFARELSVELFGWPLAFWLASQGALLGFCAIVIVYARRMARLDEEFSEPPA